MHVIIATDGSKQSLTAARFATTVLDATKITDISVLAVVRPLAAVSFSNELGPATKRKAGGEGASFRAEAEAATEAVAEVFEDWGAQGPQRRTRSGSPANEIIKAATQLGAGLVVVASGSRGISETVMLGSTAQRVQQYAPCPCLSCDRRRSRDGQPSPDADLEDLRDARPRRRGSRAPKTTSGHAARASHAR